MENTDLKAILDSYKESKIQFDEAKQMIEKYFFDGYHIESNKIKWKNDNKIRIVAFIGTKILKAGSPDCRNIEVKYDGDVLNVESCGNISCNTVYGNATAGTHITCGEIRGNATAGTSINTKSIGGLATAGGNVYIEK